MVTPSAIPTIFMPDALPATTLPIYPGLGQAPSMLAAYLVAWLAHLVVNNLSIFFKISTYTNKLLHHRIVFLVSSHGIQSEYKIINLVRYNYDQ